MNQDRKYLMILEFDCNTAKLKLATGIKKDGELILGQPEDSVQFKSILKSALREIDRRQFNGNAPK